MLHHAARHLAESLQIRHLRQLPLPRLLLVSVVLAIVPGGSLFALAMISRSSSYSDGRLR